MINEEFWLAICFVIFVGLTYKIVKRSLINLIDSKIAELSAKVVEANELRAAAEQLLATVNTKLAQQQSENQQLLDDAKKNVRNTIENKKGLLTLEIQRKLNEATKKIEQRKDLALIDLHKNFIEAAHKMTKDYITAHTDRLGSDVDIARKFIES